MIPLRFSLAGLLLLSVSYANAQTLTAPPRALAPTMAYSLNAPPYALPWPDSTYEGTIREGSVAPERPAGKLSPASNSPQYPDAARVGAVDWTRACASNVGGMTRSDKQRVPAPIACRAVEIESWKILASKRSIAVSDALTRCAPLQAARPALAPPSYFEMLICADPAEALAVARSFRNSLLGVSPPLPVGMPAPTP